MIHIIAWLNWFRFVRVGENKLPDNSILSLNTDLFVAIDFDGTVTDTDITDVIIRDFAKPGWEETERLWESGAIGSQECLAKQFALIDSPLSEIVEYLHNYSVQESFPGFVSFLRESNIPFAVISDGFLIFIERLLTNAGINGVPVYANMLSENNGTLKSDFLYANSPCPSGTCKCNLAKRLSKGRPIIHIGDGRSDFCLAEKANYVFCKGKLLKHCQEKNLPHSEFSNFESIQKNLTLDFPNL
jgi:2,3-diketo-5-methylthio-1-phosphopentane phosphatase